MDDAQAAFDDAWEALVSEGFEPGHIHQIINPEDEALAAAIWRAQVTAVQDEESYIENLRRGLAAVAERWGLRVPLLR